MLTPIRQATRAAFVALVLGGAAACTAPGTADEAAAPTPSSSAEPDYHFDAVCAPVWGLAPLSCGAYEPVRMAACGRAWYPVVGEVDCGTCPSGSYCTAATNGYCAPVC